MAKKQLIYTGDQSDIDKLVATYERFLRPKFGDGNVTAGLTERLDCLLNKHLVTDCMDFVPVRPLMSWENYLEIIGDCPSPTDEQIEHYVGAAIEMHSWYKRLGSGDSFVFGLMPDVKPVDDGIKKRMLSPKTEQEIQREGHLRLYWVGADGKTPPGYDNASLVFQELPMELCNLGIPVGKTDYQIKGQQMAYNIKVMRQLIEGKRAEI